MMTIFVSQKTMPGIKFTWMALAICVLASAEVPAPVDLPLPDSASDRNLAANDPPMDAFRRIIIVPSREAATIGEGVHLAQSGDMVMVEAGIYRETVDISGQKTILLTSRSGPEVTIICSDDPYGHGDVLTVRGTSTVRGFTITHERLPPTSENPVSHAAVLLVGPAIITGNILTGSNTGIQMYCASGAIQPPVVTHNQMTGNHYGITTLETGHIIHSNHIHHNHLDGIFVGISAEAEIKNNLIEKNQRHGVHMSASIYLETNRRMTARLINNTIVDNEGHGVFMEIAPNEQGRVMLVSWIENNQIVFNGGWGVFIQDDDPRIQPVLIYNNVFGQAWGDIPEGLGGENIHCDPWFVPGPLGEYYLSQGSTLSSECVDAGGDTALKEGLNRLTTSPGSTPDQGYVDLGYHYPTILTSETQSQLSAAVFSRETDDNQHFE